MVWYDMAEEPYFIVDARYYILYMIDLSIDLYLYLYLYIYILYCISRSSRVIFLVSVRFLVVYIFYAVPFPFPFSILCLVFFFIYTYNLPCTLPSLVSPEITILLSTLFPVISFLLFYLLLYHNKRVTLRNESSKRRIQQDCYNVHIIYILSCTSSGYILHFNER